MWRRTLCVTDHSASLNSLQQPLHFSHWEFLSCLFFFSVSNNQRILTLLYPPSTASYPPTRQHGYPQNAHLSRSSLPGENEIVIGNGVVAINPLDWFKQDAADMMFSWIKYPFIMGSDLAGEVVEVGRASCASRLATVLSATQSAWTKGAINLLRARSRNTP